MQQPYFVNNTTFVVPLAATVNNIRSLDKKVYLTVTIVKSVKCPKKMFGEYDFLLNQDDVKPVPEKEKYHTQKSGNLKFKQEFHLVVLTSSLHL